MKGDYINDVLAAELFPGNNRFKTGIRDGSEGRHRGELLLTILIAPNVVELSVRYTVSVAHAELAHRESYRYLVEEYIRVSLDLRSERHPILEEPIDPECCYPARLQRWK